MNHNEVETFLRWLRRYNTKLQNYTSLELFHSAYRWKHPVLPKANTSIHWSHSLYQRTGKVPAYLEEYFRHIATNVFIV